MHDAIVIGGSFAGLSAAIYLARGRHDVMVLDTGSPRNRFSPASHGVFAQDGASPAAMIRTARAQVGEYPTAAFRDVEAVDAQKVENGFAVELATGEVIAARRLVIASGVEDLLPPIPGLQERWGRSVIHCPYCHGYEYSGQRLGVLNVGPMSVHQAMLIAHWGPTTFFLDSDDPLDAETMAAFRERDISVEPGRVVALAGQGSALEQLVLTEDRRIALDALYVAPQFRVRGAIAGALGCAMREEPLGQILAVDQTFMTSVPGVYAAGDVARSWSLAAAAAADGAQAGGAASQSLIFGLPQE